MAKKFFEERRPHNGLTYNEYIQMSVKNVEKTDESKLSRSEKSNFEYSKLNLHRARRIEKTYEVNKETCVLIDKIVEPQLWMVITEDWCGDSAQNLPYIAKIAECNLNINLRIVLRDDNLDIMDQYLTNGKSRSIPKLVAFDEAGDELFQWGPRPSEAQKMVMGLKEEGISKDDYLEKLHLWYGRNRGKNIENEFIEILKSI